MNLSKLLGTLNQSPTVALADKVRLIESQGKKIVHLHTGDPDFATHPLIVEASQKAIKGGLTHYSNSRGLPILREEICNYMGKKYNALLSPEEILITHGGIHAYYLAIKTLVNLGDEILIPDPTWISHVNVIKACGGIPVEYQLREENAFLPQISDLEILVTANTKAIVINFPSNPLGTLPSEDLMKQILDFAERKNLMVISDEVYDHIIFGGKKFPSVLSYPSVKDRVIVCQSFSKTFAMTGWRIGYLIGPKNFINQSLKISQCTITNVAPFIQMGAHGALSSREVMEYVKEMNLEYEKRANSVVKLLNESPSKKISFTKPAGAFYFFINIKKLGWGNSLSASTRILDELSIAVVPGSAFGKLGEGYIRATFATSSENIEEGFKKLLSVE